MTRLLRPTAYCVETSHVVHGPPLPEHRPPSLAEIWRSQPPRPRGLMQPVSPSVLEICVFSKQYFDPSGLLVATRDEVPIGFAHGGFGPDESGKRLDKSVGVTQLVLVRSDIDEPGVDDALLQASERQLRDAGASVLYGGGICPLNPFYLGLYGGSELPGVLDSDPTQQMLFERNEYDAISRIVVLQRDLARFRMPMTRSHRQLRRELEVKLDPPGASEAWFDAVQHANIDVMHFRLVRRRDQATLARVEFWEIEPLASSWGHSTAGMRNLFVEPACRRNGLASYLVSEAFKEVQKRGVTVIEAHTMQDNQIALDFYDALGFTAIDYGSVYRRRPLG